MTATAFPPPPRPVGAGPSLGLLAVVAVVCGVAVGAVTSFGQAHLSETLNPLVNSVSAWLVAPFALGLATRRRGVAAAALVGLLTCVVQVLAYYAIAHLRGYASSHAEVVFWTVAGLIGGPVFGAAAATTAVERLRGLAAATLSATFLAEGLWTYGHTQDRWDSAALWCVLGAASLIVEGPRAAPLAARWLTATLPLGVFAFALVTWVHG